MASSFFPGPPTWVPRMNEKKIKAVGLLSGGLDSTLAARLMLDQGIEVLAINFISPFCQCTGKKAGCASVVRAVEQLGNIPLKRVYLGEEYLLMVRGPEHGYGRGMNPCIDCRIMKISRAAEFMKECGASFLFTGEVLGQRPMSQFRRAIELIDRKTGMSGLILRPLSAVLFPPTVPEKMGWVDRTRLLGVKGRSRKAQIDLAREKGIADYPCPAGGCRLTDPNFALRLREYFRHTADPALADMPLLKTGRHFRLENGDRVVVARDEGEGEILSRIRSENDLLLVPANFSGPTVLLRGSDVDEALRKIRLYSRKSLPTDASVECRRGSGSTMVSIQEKA